MGKHSEHQAHANGKPALRSAGIAIGSAVTGGALLALGVLLAPARESDFIPLPGDAIPSLPASNPLLDLAGRAISDAGAQLTPTLPDSMLIRTDGGRVDYDSSARIISYTAGEQPLYLRTNEGQEIFTRGIIADLEKKEATLQGPLIIYQGETLTYAEGGRYNWSTGLAAVERVRAKVNGLLVRGSAIEYGKDDQKKNYISIHDAYISTEDVETPDMWVGTGQLTIYPGDYGVITRLSIAGEESDMAVPVLGWITISHSLNPREGYMPLAGAKSIWGAYLKNRYGFLLGNRRVEHGMPVADYVATLLLDYRTRRGLAGGMEFTDEAMRRKYGTDTGLSIYYAADREPDVNPSLVKRDDISSDRYRIAMQAHWDLPMPEALSRGALWSTAVNLNLLSDKYVLPDFFEDIAKVDDKPDNSLRLERRTEHSRAMLFTRFAPNDFYSTDQRAEISYYRARTILGNTRIAYETRNSIALIRQNLPADQRAFTRHQLSMLRDEDTRAYYTRLLDTSDYTRIHSSHEFTAPFNAWRFLNITPKLGGGFSGYYGVSGIHSDNRVLGFAACDFDIKFHRDFADAHMPSAGIHGLYHTIHPYATISHGTISSANPYVPQVDTWSNTLGCSTINPIPLDLMSFTGIDGWDKWTIWRLGMRNVLSTIYDDESRTLVNWNVFIDYNIDNPNSANNFSNLYSILTFQPKRQFSLNFETQTPTIRGGDGFSQYNTSIVVQPYSWLEANIGHRYISNHPVQMDASMLYLHLNLRINEKYTFATRLYMNIDQSSMPLQQYSIFRKFGPWHIGSTLFLRDNGGKKETGLGISFTLGETATALPITLY